MNEFIPEYRRPNWACWCIPPSGAIIHDYSKIACPICGRLQPPKNVTKIIMHSSPRPSLLPIAKLVDLGKKVN